MVAGFFGLVWLGLSLQGTKSPPLQLAFLLGAVAYFVWLATWTTWSKPKS